MKMIIRTAEPMSLSQDWPYIFSLSLSNGYQCVSIKTNGAREWGESKSWSLKRQYSK